MGKSKRNKSPPPNPSPSNQETEGEPSVPDDPNSTSDPEVEGWTQKYMGENQMTWFRRIIRAQSKDFMSELIAKEVQKVKQEIQVEMNEIVTNLENEKSIKEARDIIEDLKSENLRRKREIERLEFTNSRKQAMIEDLKIKLDGIQQDKHENSVQIVGFPENKNETDDIKQLTKVFKEKAGVKIKSSDIVEMKRLGKQNDKKIRNIILKFKDKETRQKIYNERKKLVINGNPKKSVYLNDSLTQHRQELLYAARQLVKQKRLYAAWSQAGNILVRKAEDSNITQVHNHDDLMILKSSETESVRDEDSSRQPEETSSELTHLSGYSYYCDSDI